MATLKIRGRGIYFILSFWAAFLLFLIQPIMAKLLLPLFGGAAAVWLVSLVFFTGFLLLGYLYAHFLILKLEAKKQVMVHFIVVFISLLAAVYELSIFNNSLAPLKAQVLAGVNFPAFTLLVVLLKTMGWSYFVLASTSPIIQAWYGRAGLGAPYKLYSISNAGSLLAIAIYPFALEPLSTVIWQSRAWLIGFLVFGLLLAMAGLKFLARPPLAPVSRTLWPKEKISLKMKLAWLGLAILPALMLLTVTTRITKGIAAVPWLWLLPLAIYLISFIICFSGKKKLTAALTAKIWGFIFIVLAIALAWLNFLAVHFLILILAEVLVFGATAMFCHSRLYELKPEIGQLTLYYLYLSWGGALGAALVGLIAPMIFSGYYEYGLVLAAALLLAGYLLRQEIRELDNLLKRRILWLLWLVALALILNLFNFILTGDRVREKTVLRQRNFFGALTVKRAQTKEERMLKLFNGRILHGSQFLGPDKSSIPTTYYSETSGAGLALRAKQKLDQRPERVGIVGLGAGTLAAYCRAGDSYTFYDINPGVVAIANRDFSYLKQCGQRGGQVNVKVGDARLVLEKELRQAGSQSYDILILDAFSDDAIPVHLLTREAMEIYLARLTPDGVLAVHVSNRYLNLKPVLRVQALEFGLNDAVVEDSASDGGLGKISSSWVLLARDKTILVDKTFKDVEYLDKEKAIRLWTDQFSNLLPLLKW